MLLASALAVSGDDVELKPEHSETVTLNLLLMGARQS